MITTRTCSWPHCDEPLNWGGRGRKPVRCAEHRKPRYATQLSRQRTANEKAAGTWRERPECCASLGPRRKCPQHQEPYGLSGMPEIMSASDEYAGALPKGKHVQRDDLTGEAMEEGLTVKGERIAVSSLTLLEQAMTERDYRGAAIPVIGQPDLTADWQSVEPGWRADFASTPRTSEADTNWASKWRYEGGGVEDAWARIARDIKVAVWGAAA